VEEVIKIFGGKQKLQVLPIVTMNYSLEIAENLLGLRGTVLISL
jgi:hypothetical protein